jgi:hypothetical protein
MMDADNRMQLAAWGWLFRSILIVIGMAGGIAYLISLVH